MINNSQSNKNYRRVLDEFDEQFLDELNLKDIGFNAEMKKAEAKMKEVIGVRILPALSKLPSKVGKGDQRKVAKIMKTKIAPRSLLRQGPFQNEQNRLPKLIPKQRDPVSKNCFQMDSGANKSFLGNESLCRRDFIEEQLKQQVQKERAVSYDKPLQVQRGGTYEEPPRKFEFLTTDDDDHFKGGFMNEKFDFSEEKERLASARSRSEIINTVQKTKQASLSKRLEGKASSSKRIVEDPHILEINKELAGLKDRIDFAFKQRKGSVALFIRECCLLARMAANANIIEHSLHEDDLHARLDTLLSNHKVLQYLQCKYRNDESRIDSVKKCILQRAFATKDRQVTLFSSNSLRQDLKDSVNCSEPRKDRLQA